MGTDDPANAVDSRLLSDFILNWRVHVASIFNL